MIKTFIVQIETDTDLSESYMFTIVDDELILTGYNSYHNSVDVINVKEIPIKGDN